MKKIIQISHALSEYGASSLALCEDGSLYMYSLNTGEWTKIPPIPEEKKEVEK